MKKILLTMAALASATAMFAQDIESILSSMTREEKIAQIVIISIDSQDTLHHGKQMDLARRGLGGVIIMDDKLDDNISLINRLQKEAKLPMLVSIDGEWGASMRYREYAAFPRAMQLGALTGPELVYKVGEAIGEELAELKIFANYAPVVDVNNNPDNPVINTRSFGEDREKVAEFGSAYMLGMKSKGVAGSAKHFPGHGDTDVDSHKGLPVLTFSRERLDELELYPFRRQIADGVDMVMVGHLSVPALDPTNTPASISKPIVTGLLRNELGFDGIIITDALEMKGVATGYNDASLAAYEAGADILLIPLDADATIRDLNKAFEEGRYSEEDLDNRVRKMLRLKARCGMLDKGYSPFVDVDALDQMSRRPETEALIQEICDKTMTVVKGAENLPVKLGRKVAYVAFNAVTEQSAKFAEELSKYGRFDSFSLPYDATAAQIDSLGKLLKRYKTVIVGIHSGVPIPSTGGPKRFAKIDPAQFERIASWSSDHDLIGFYLGNPYDLNNMPDHVKFRSFFIGYSDTEFNNRAAAKTIAKGGAEGVLPVGAGGYPCGYRSDAARSAQDLYELLHPSTDIVPLSVSFSKNQVRSRDQLAKNDNLDIITYIASQFTGFRKLNGGLVSSRSGSFNNGAPTFDPVVLYADGVKVDWSYVAGMTVSNIQKMYVLRGNEAALYQAYGGGVFLELKKYIK